MIAENKEYLLTEQWYINLLPMVLRDSYGFKEQLSYFVNQLQQLDFVCDCYENAKDLYNLTWYVKKNKDGKIIEDKSWKVKDKNGKLITFENYEQFLEWFGDTPFTLLDDIAALVGVSRNFIYEYQVDEGGTTVTKKDRLILSNRELYHDILIAISRNNYDGTRDMITQLYQKAFIDTGIIKSITYKRERKLEVLITIIYNKGKITENEKKLFVSGEYLIKSLGINYSVRLIESADTLFTFNTNNILDNVGTII